MSEVTRKILCVDDHTDFCELVAAILQDVKVVSAHSVAEAVALATKEKFDLYLLDYHLPDGTGLELCLLLRGFDAKTPILFMTGTSSISEAQAINAGADGLVKKGRTEAVADLRSKVTQLLAATGLTS
ncbi:MAG TPA: response regulator [Pyrinomonadaceae bacterium]|jgi:CheY-like chemotaxis protein|nr:response regulator [Pyrinomonadaceae bacterium]